VGNFGGRFNYSVDLQKLARLRGGERKMTDMEFQEVLKSRLEATERVLGIKALEYAKGDRLHNFLRAGALLRCTPEKALLGFLTKHLVSVVDMVEDLDKGVSNPIPVWEEKIGDAINYLVLLEACIKRSPRAGR
jgi:hypothetical protein